MTKSQLTQLISEKMNITKTQASLFFDVLTDIALEQLSTKGVFIIPDMAKFAVKSTKDVKRLTTSAVGELKKRLIV